MERSRELLEELFGHYGDGGTVQDVFARVIPEASKDQINRLLVSLIHNVSIADPKFSEIQVDQLISTITQLILLGRELGNIPDSAILGKVHAPFEI